MKVRITKLREDAVIPSYAKSGDAGMDLTAVSVEKDDFGNLVYGTDICRAPALCRYLRVM